MSSQQRGRSTSPSGHARGTSPSPKPKAPTNPRNSKDPRPLVPTSVLAAGSKEAQALSAQLAAAVAESNELYPLSADLAAAARVPRNARGGVAVSAEELKAGYDMLDLEKSGFVTLTSLRKRLGFFYPDMTPKEYRFLMNNRKEITLHDLEELLADNDVAGFDPVAEAFRLFAGPAASSSSSSAAAAGAGAAGVSGAGAAGAGPETDASELALSIPASRLRQVFSAYGFGDLSEEEYRVLVRSADVDGDGRVTLADFRAMLALAEHGGEAR